MLKDKTALVVGASGDIGLEICSEFLKNRALVVATYRCGGARLDSLSEKFGTALVPKSLDVRDAAAVDRFAESLEADGLVPDILIYNAGIVKDSPALGMEDSDWSEVIEINLTGAFRVARAVAKPMSLRKKGKIFFVSSVAGMKGGRGQANYAASKAGLEALARTLASELSRKNILVNSIAPGVIESRMSATLMESSSAEVLSKILLGRPGRPSEVARLIVHLSSDDVTYITGQTFNIDGGFKL